MIRDNFYLDKRVLCTGGAGFVGSNLVRRLVSLGAKVTVVDDLFTGSIGNLAGQIRGVDYEFFESSVNDSSAVYFYVSRSDIIFHLAARNIIASTKNPIDDYQTNIGGTLNILQAMKDYPCLKLVYTSSASVYGNPKYLPINEEDGINLLTPYAVSKYAGEGYCMAFHESYDIPVTVLRLSNVYGPWQSPLNPYCGVVAKFMDSALQAEAINIHGDGLSTRDFTYVDDVVDALILAGESTKAEGEVFNIATGIETTIEELAQSIAIKYEWENYNESEIEIEIKHIDRRDIDNVRRRVLNVEKARRKLGWTPKTTLQQGIKLTKDWFDG